MNKNINDEYWMGIVDKIARASTCRVKIGTLLIQNRKIVGVGFLGSVPGDIHCDEEGCLLVDSPHQGSDNTGKGCRRTIHSEINAILNRTPVDLSQGYLECYTTYEPCLNCLKCLLSIGVRKIIYRNYYKDEHRDFYFQTLSGKILNRLMIEKCDL